MTKADGEFHDFVVTFADPLERLAYVLLADVPDGDSRADQAAADARAVSALAQTRRHWRDVESTGAPEPLAVEALLVHLPRPPHGRRHEPAPAAPIATPGPASADADADPEADIRAIRAALWRAWCTLSPRQRVPLLFTDARVVSPRLAGLDVPEAFGSQRRRQALASSALTVVRRVLAGEPVPVVAATAGVPDGELLRLLGETLRNRAEAVPAPVDPYSRACAAARHHRARAFAAAAVVVAVAASGTAVAASVSTSRHKPAGAAASATASPAALGVANQARSAVVDWPTRGSAATDTVLLANLRTAFVSDHPDATGVVQVLLATDTPAYRLAYVTANSPSGVLQSWFYGPVGAHVLDEGAFSYGAKLVHASVLAWALADQTGHTELVVVGPPETTEVHLRDLESGASAARGLQPLPSSGGVSVEDVSDVYVPALYLVVKVGTTAAQVPVQSIQLRALPGHQSLTSASAATPTAPAPGGQAGPPPSEIASVPVERGNPDPALLEDAVARAHDWQRTGAFPAGAQPVVVWGGTETSGRKVVVLRLETLHLADLLIVVWSGAPGEDAEYLLAPDTPDLPVAFVYGGQGGGRVGVLAPGGIATASLEVDGVGGPRVPVGPTGFASMPVQGQYGLLADQTFTVDLFDAAGQLLRQVPVPPRA